MRFFLLLLLFSVNLFAQSPELDLEYLEFSRAGNVPYTPPSPLSNSSQIKLSYSEFNTNPTEAPKFENGKFFWGTGFDNILHETTNYIWKPRLTKLERHNMVLHKQATLNRLKFINEIYSNPANFPAKIIDGWHEVLITDNANFCRNAKALVTENRITKLVVEDFLPLSFQNTGEINQCKSIVTIKEFNGQNFSFCAVYFLYDIDKPNTTEQPGMPGVVAFWTKSTLFATYKIVLNNQYLERFTGNFCGTEPDCGDLSLVKRGLKPGKYTLKAVAKDGTSVVETLEVKSGQCLMVRLGKE